ncbi:hypothetical protein ACO34A_26550 (plasmid) [Rhizobium sp. ACO-34A]|nr:hypothetical protein [Rhizobium sp. ACO-34A]ATN37329.1 hypothetical protein ACO34A_26550 [Rhizobium sp. ACO-34A]
MFPVFAIVAFRVFAIILYMRQPAFAGSCTVGAMSAAAGPKAGMAASWNGGSHSLYAEGPVTTSLGNFGESHSLQGKAGFRIIW